MILKSSLKVRSQLNASLHVKSRLKGAPTGHTSSQVMSKELTLRQVMINGLPSGLIHD